MQPTIYNIRDRFKELSSYSGMAVAVLAVVLPQFISPHALIEILMPCGSIIGALLFFMPENRAVLSAEQAFDIVLKMLPAQYRVAALKDPVIGAVAGDAGSSGVQTATAVGNALAMALLVCVLGMGLAGCAQSPPGTTAATGSAGTSAAASAAPAAAPLATAAQTLQALQGFSAADLSNAIRVATAAEPTNPYAVEIVTCLTWWQTVPSQLQGVGTPPSGTVGAATLFTEGMLGLDNAASLTGSATQAKYEQACGPLNTHLVNQGITLATQLAALAGRLGVKIAVPAVAAVPGL